ncbi:MAG: LytTR family transcriptional regulator DNA-binding domain-containing protein [Bacteroidaceae bacterium]|nr:LytTR family transcriptional regulator DNA-binding domain-containing protein [Bacteroidaceae bacterium]
MTKNSIITVPKQILQRRFLLRSVLFVSLFSMLFMALYQPAFTYSTTWFGFHSWKQAGVTALFYAVAISTLIISKLLLFKFSRSHSVTVKRILIWHIVEFFAIATEYYLFSVYFRLGSVEIPQLLIRIPMCVALILAIPYSIIWLYAQYKAKKEELELFKVTHKRETIESDHRLIQFRDSQGKHKMSLSEDSIFYIESQDNYVQIFYDLEGKLSSYLLRCSTQKIEEDLTGTSIVRCRRSFLVNTAKIVRWGKERGRFSITLSQPSGKTITVTPAYYRTILTHLDGRSL